MGEVDMVSVPRAELDALKAENRRLRLERNRAQALAAMLAHPAPEPGNRQFTTAGDLLRAAGLRG